IVAVMGVAGWWLGSSGKHEEIVATVEPVRSEELVVAPPTVAAEPSAKMPEAVGTRNPDAAPLVIRSSRAALVGKPVTLDGVLSITMPPVRGSESPSLRLGLGMPPVSRVV